MNKIRTKIREVFKKYEVHNPNYFLEKEIEKNPELNQNHNLCKTIPENTHVSISFKSSKNWENNQIMSIGVDFPYREELLLEVTPLYQELAKETFWYNNGTPSQFNILELNDITMIGLISKYTKEDVIKLD